MLLSGLLVNNTSEYWYDTSLPADGYDGFEVRFAARVENGATGKIDPLMGGLVSAFLI